MPFVDFELRDFCFRNFLFEQIWVQGEQLTFVDVINSYFRFLDHEYWEHIVVELSKQRVVFLIFGASIIIVEVEGIELEEPSAVSPEDLVWERKDALASELLRCYNGLHIYERYHVPEENYILFINSDKVGSSV